MKALIRADGGGSGLGLGHLSRCVAIAEALQEMGISSTFICKDYSPGIEFVRQNAFEVIPISTTIDLDQEILLTQKLLADHDLFIVDSHELNANYFASFQHFSQLIVCLDDEMQRNLPVDVIIGNGYATSEQYANKTNQNTILLLGTEYLPLRKHFQKCPKKEIAEHPRKLFISMGGEDPSNMTQQLIEACKALPFETELLILIGNAYRHKKTLTQLLNSLPYRYQLLEQPQSVWEYYKQADIAVVAGGVTVWEFLALGVPSIVIQIAHNQAQNIQYFKKEKLAVVLERPEQMALSIEQLKTAKIRSEYSQRGQKKVDGLGANRIAQKLKEFTIAKLANDIRLKPAEPSIESVDCRLIWEWRNDPLTREMSRTRDFVTWEKHLQWYVVNTKSSACFIFIGFLKDQPLGMLRFDLDNKGSAEINLNLNPAFRSKGLATPFLLAGLQEAKRLGIKKITAFIKKENVASQKVFEQAGFVLVGVESPSELLCYEANCHS